MGFRSLLSLSIAALSLASTSTHATPRLSLPDLFLPFAPGVLSYDLNRGEIFDEQEFTNIGVTNLTVTPDLDILPHDDDPNGTARVRVTISEDDPTQNPNGDITIVGKRYTRNWVLGGLSTTNVTETLHFITNDTKTTLEDFDEVTEIIASGFSMDVDLDVAFWDGHEQEVDVLVGLLDVADAAECSEYYVRLNGLKSPLIWSAIDSSCTAGRTAFGIANRGVYFPVNTDTLEGDAIFYAAGGTSSWQNYVQGFPHGAFYFDVAAQDEDTRLRPLLAELVRIADSNVVDRARSLFTITIDPNGVPQLLPKLALATNAGAFTQLSPHGLSRLDATHADTLPYPINPSGTQPRLSTAAIAQPSHYNAPIDDTGFDLSDEHDYWVDSRGGGPEWQGHLAYEEILQEAEDMFVDFGIDMAECLAKPPILAGLCTANQAVKHCVRTPPVASHFQVRVDGLTTYFDPAFVDDALVIGNVKAMDLEFGTNEIEADFTLFDLDGKMEGVIDSSDVRIEYKSFGPCFIEPDDVVLSDFVGPNTEDYQGFLQCPALDFFAASATLTDPVRFAITAVGESMYTPFLAPVEFELAGVEGSATIGTCSEGWMTDFLVTAVEGWTPTVEDTIATDWILSPSQDEALNRLLSPLELGVPEVSAPPPGTPPYSVQPLDRYQLKADIAKTTSDPEGLFANPVDGLYVPYLTQSISTGGVPFPFWFCQAHDPNCAGLQGGHAGYFEGGVDADGDSFDILLSLTTAHLNQALRAQARRDDRLGSPTHRIPLSISNTSLVDTANARGHTDVVDALDAISGEYGIRYHHAAAPFTLLHDSGSLIYATPNIVVEVVSIDTTGVETVQAKILLDVIDRDLSLNFREGGVPSLEATFGDLHVLDLTATFVPDCTGQCDESLREVVLDLLMPTIETVVLEMIENMPTPQLFDSGQESSKPRHLTNVRAAHYGQSVYMFADFCRADIDC